MKAFSAEWICPVSSSPVRNGTLVVDAGRILEIAGAPPPGIPVESFPGCALLPGFVNTHTHLELTLLRGFLENLPFDEWIRRLTRAKYELLSHDDLRLSARLGALESLSGGVTTVGEVMDAGTGLEAMARFHLRGIAYQEVFGPDEAQAGEALEELREKVRRARSQEDGTRRIGVSPHAPYTVSARLYRSVRAWAEREGLPVAVHVAESAAESRFVRDGAGPFGDAWRRRKIPVVPRGVGPIRYLDRLGLLGPATLAIHAVDSSPDDIALLRDRGTGVAHCPKSNLKLGHGIAPLWELLEAGIPVGLGTDSVASNNVVDMFEEMRTAVFLQRARRGDATAIGAARALRMATLDGARCLGMDHLVGSLERGKLADFIVVGLNDPARTPVYDPVEAVVYSANRDTVRATFLAGEPVRVDPSEEMRRTRSVIERLNAG